MSFCYTLKLHSLPFRISLELSLMTAVAMTNRFRHCHKMTAIHLIIKTDSFYTNIQNILIVSCCYGIRLVFHNCSRQMQWHQFTQSLNKIITLLDVV